MVKILLIAGILLYSVTLSLQYQLFPTCNNTGYPCILDRECCGHTCCINDVCTPSEICNPCKDVVCGYKEKCYFETPKGITDQPPFGKCAPEDPCHKADCGKNYKCEVIQIGDRPPKAKCVPLFDLCKGIKCSAFQQCYITIDGASCSDYNIRDLTYPPLPKPICAYSNPCVINSCNQGYECTTDTFDEDSVPTARCYPISNPCVGMICGLDEQCYIIDNYIHDLSIPIAKCLPVDPCSRLNCRDGFACVRQDTFPPSAECVLQADPCENVTCHAPEKCYLEYVQCVKAPCYPIAGCADPDPCKSHKCPDDYECINHPEDQYTAPKAKCINPSDPCKDFPCGINQICTFDQIFCFTTPCIQQPYCIDINPCANITCAVGYECVAVSAGSKTKYGQCYRKNNPCKYTFCPDDSTCMQTKKFPSLGICYDPTNGERNCTEIACDKGYECKDFDNPPLSSCIPTCDTCPANTICIKVGYPSNVMCSSIALM